MFPDCAAYGDSQGPRVCILGGGFGGLYTAVRLESLMWPKGNKPRVTLIDQSDRFVFKPLLYELLTGAATEDEVAPTFARLLAPYPVTFLQGKVAAVQPDVTKQDGTSEGGGAVLLQNGLSVPYDWLVLALGSETNTFGVPGVKELALPFSTYSDAMRVIERLEVLEANVMHPEVVVVGGGYAGVEVAAVIAERLAGRARIKLLTAGPQILETSTEGQREAALAALQDKGISILTGASVAQLVRAGAHPPLDADADLSKRVVYVTDRLGQQEIIEADLVVWAAGSSPVPKVEAGNLSIPFPTNARGATQTDPTLRVLGHPRVFALGDVAMSRSGASVGAGAGGDLTAGQQLPATAQVAFQQADYVAWNLWSAINNKPLLNFSYQHLGDMMSLGTTNGAVALPFSVPPPLSSAAQTGPLGELLRAAGVRITPTGLNDGVTVEGPLAAALRRVAYLYRQPTDEQRVRVAASWAQQAAKQAAGLAQQVLTGVAPRDGRTGGSNS
ncbi:hypothetical protein N2152v2_009226 [Parachlorella kessleri]